MPPNLPKMVYASLPSLICPYMPPILPNMPYMPPILPNMVVYPVYAS